MKQRSISALGVALVGFVPAIMGGPIWLVAFTVVCLIGYHEYRSLTQEVGPRIAPVGLILLPVFASVSYFNQAELAAFGVVGIALALPLVLTVLQGSLEESFHEWGLSVAGTLYLGLPLFAAIQLRSMPGEVSRAWVADLADFAALGWPSHERGLAWLVTIILTTWLADTFAYLVGKRFGRTKLTPMVSPNKTVEGFAGGLVAAAVTGAVAFRVFGLDDRIWLGLIFGVTVAIVALFGDLSESVLKRAAGVKDSGNIIPGHGGILDRVDALLFTFVAGWYLALTIDHFVL